MAIKAGRDIPLSFCPHYQQRWLLCPLTHSEGHQRLIEVESQKIKKRSTAGWRKKKQCEKMYACGIYPCAISMHLPEKLSLLSNSLKLQFGLAAGNKSPPFRLGRKKDVEWMETDPRVTPKKKKIGDRNTRLTIAYSVSMSTG